MFDITDLTTEIDKRNSYATMFNQIGNCLVTSNQFSLLTSLTGVKIRYRLSRPTFCSIATYKILNNCYKR